MFGWLWGTPVSKSRRYEGWPSSVALEGYDVATQPNNKKRSDQPGPRWESCDAAVRCGQYQVYISNMSYTTRRLWYSNMRRFRGFGSEQLPTQATHSRSETACALPVFVPNRGPHPTIRPAWLAPSKARNPGWGWVIVDIVPCMTSRRLGQGLECNMAQLAEASHGLQKTRWAKRRTRLRGFKFDDVPGHSCGGIGLANLIRCVQSPDVAAATLPSWLKVGCAITWDICEYIKAGDGSRHLGCGARLKNSNKASSSSAQDLNINSTPNLAH
jgi:hypothetical protein